MLEVGRLAQIVASRQELVEQISRLSLRPLPAISSKVGMAGSLIDLSVIEAAADLILSEVGLRFEGDPETLELLRGFGFEVQGEQVRLEGPVLRRLIAERAPRHFVLQARNAARDVNIGLASPVHAPVYGPPNAWAADGARQWGDLALYRQLVAMSHDAPGLANTGHLLCVLNDQPEPLRPFQMALAHLELSDKGFMGPVSSAEDLKAVSQAVAEVYGRAPGDGACNLLHLINSTPALTYKANPLRCLRAAAIRGEACMITSYMMMGATAPVTVAGSLIQGYAEVMAGLALCQLWQPGTPVVAGIYAVPFDMQYMIPRFGDPASALVQHAAVGLAHRLSVPARGDGGGSSAKTDDAQSGYDGANALFHCHAAGADLILHAAGWLEQGRTVGVAKFRRESTALPASSAQAEMTAPDPRQMVDLRRRWGLS